MRDLMRSSRDLEEESQQREMNQKLQLMLEETITKNMHLQQVPTLYILANCPYFDQNKKGGGERKYPCVPIFAQTCL